MARIVTVRLTDVELFIQRRSLSGFQLQRTAGEQVYWVRHDESSPFLGLPLGNGIVLRAVRRSIFT